MDKQIKVPIKNEEGKTVLEDWNPQGAQSDGSQYFQPQRLTTEDHEHLFVKPNPSDRQVVCSCGYGGFLYPHQGYLKDGHVYNRDNKRIV